jgi:hypothetical protein
MVLAISNALAIDIGLIGVFFVLVPAIVTVLLVIAGAGVYVEKLENEA